EHQLGSHTCCSAAVHAILPLPFYHENRRSPSVASQQVVVALQTYSRVCNATTVARCCTSMQQEKPRPTRPLRYCCTSVHGPATLEKAGTTSRATSRDICAAWCNTAQQRATRRNRPVPSSWRLTPHMVQRRSCGRTVGRIACRARR